MIAAGVRILVVEDHAFQRRALLQTLARLGAAAPLEAADGEAALAILCSATDPVDIIISDLDMPGMDGIEFIRRVAGCGRAPAMIAVSAVDRSVLASVEAMARAYGISMLGVLAKPVAPQQLQELIDRYAAGDRAAAATQAATRVFGWRDIEDGLARDEFEPWFQPKVELATGRVRGFEALARWRHVDAGVVSPAAFLPAMEEHGLVDELARIMLKKSAACCSQWRAGGQDVSVAVNLSVRSLALVQLADQLTAIVRAEGLEPRNAILEVTESAAATGHLGPVLENLARLRLKGFGLSIDDFGTGYSSVQQLGRVAFTELKIDQSFVRDAGSREASMVILRSSLQMARDLRLVAVAEGIETAGHWALLRDLRCDLGQGYFIAAPMPHAQVPAWIAQWQAQDRSALPGSAAVAGASARQPPEAASG